MNRITRVSKRRYSNQLGMAALMMALTASTAAFAQEQTANYSVPAQPLSSGLLELARQAHISIMAPPALVAGKAGKAAQGKMTLRAALNVMLDGSGLKAEFVAPDAVRIVDAKIDTTAGGRDDPQQTVDGESTNVDELVVVGTHIKGQAPIGSKPVVLGRGAIADTGRVNMTELLKVIPQLQTLGASDGTRSGRGQGAISNNGAGSSVNIRGLGAESTLALVNGRRIAPSAGGAFVDISQIPVSALERVEVLPDGASALYGSDAVGGVVNFVTRKKFDGVDATVHYGMGDGFHESLVGLTGGADWGSGSATLAYEYYNRSNLRSYKRSYARTDLSGLGGDNFFPVAGAAQYAGNPGTIMVGATPYAAIPLGQNGQGLTVGQLVVGQFNQLDPQAPADLYPTQKRDSVVLSVVQELTPSIGFFADGLYSKRDFVQHNRPDTRAVVVGPANPFFIAGIPGSLTSNTVRYSFLEDYDNRTEGASTNYTVTAGLKFDLPFAWSGELYGTEGQDDLVTRGLGLVNNVRLALAAGTPGAAGVRPAGLPYFNPFGDGSFTDPATLAYVEGSSWNHQVYDIESVTLSAGGPLFDLPGGTVRMAVGVDTRKETYKSERIDDTDTLTPEVVTLNSASGFGVGAFSRRIDAAYAEVSVPLVGTGNAMPFVEKLDLSLAVRREDYSDFGTTTNPKVGLSWQPVEGLSFRGTWGTSFRAPRLVELDERANAYFIRPWPNPGAVLGDPSTFAPAPANSWIIYLADSGNGKLQPETAKSYTLGADFTPAALPGFKASLTYYNIEYEDRILTPSTPELLGALAGSGTPGIVLELHPTQAILDAIYAGQAGTVGLPAGPFKDSGFPGAFLPGFPNNQLPAANIYAILHAGLTNYGTVQTDGWDVSASYAFNTDLGLFEIGGVLTYVSRYEVTRGTGAALDLLNTMGNPVSVRSRSTLSWSKGPFDAQFSINHIGGYLNPYKNQKVSAWNTADLHLGYRIDSAVKALDGVKVSFDVENLFDAEPPFVNNQSSSIGYDSELASARGRFLGLTVRKAW